MVCSIHGTRDTSIYAHSSLNAHKCPIIKQTNKQKKSEKESDNFKDFSIQCAASAWIGMRRLRETRRIYRLRSCVSAVAATAAAADATDARRASKSVLRKRITHVISSRWVSTLQRVDFSGQKKVFEDSVYPRFLRETIMVTK